MKTSQLLKSLAVLVLFAVAMAVLVGCSVSVVSGVPRITLDPTSGGSHTIVTIKGEGYPPQTVLSVRLGPPNVGATPESYGRAVTDDAGNFTIIFEMPGEWPDRTPIVEEDLVVVVLNEDGSVKATAPFTFLPASASPGSSGWIEYRDVRDGYGLAIPCHWNVIPTPMEGNYAALTLRSYDDAFFMANSLKGEWKGGQWPNDAVKMDIVVIEGIPPDQPLIEALRELLMRNDSSLLENLAEVMIGSYPAVEAVTVSSNNPADVHRMLALRLAPDKMLLVSTSPEEAWASGDVQGILNSIAISREESVIAPGYSPGTPIIEVPEHCASGEPTVP